MKGMVCLLVAMALVLAGSVSIAAAQAAGLKKGFYKKSCPQAEDIAQKVVWNHVAGNRELAAKFLRMFFHDCFVRGCDASVLLDSPTNTAEKDAPPNLSLAGFEVIDEVKAALERACPGVVSCADIVALAARDSVSFQYGKKLWEVETGRRDGTTSFLQQAFDEIPAPSSTFDILLANFSGKGLGLQDLVVLSGGHTIGIGNCNLFSSRVFNFTGKNNPTDIDPSLNPPYAKFLQGQCRRNLQDPNDNTTVVPMDPGSSTSFDSHYFVNLKARQGMFTSDATLLTNGRAAALVDKLQDNGWTAGSLFDEMSRRLKEEGSTAVGEHRIGDLPDDLLAYLMSFLPSRDSVRTCVLARRWRTLWKSVPALRLEDDPRGDDGPRSKFVDELLCRRHPTPLSVCDISSEYNTFHCEEAFKRIKPWLRYAFTHDVRALRVVAGSLTTNLVLVSSHLKRVELCFMQFKRSVDFTGCQALDVLEMKGCNILASILCKSVRHLTIKGGCFDDKTRRRISAPNLISLKLAPCQGLTPLLDSMPSLVTASVESFDQQYHYCFDVPCEGCDRQAGFPVVLEGLSAATNLELTTDDQLSIFRMDLKWCPMFSKLKCLLLNKWCVADDFTELVYFLQHSPILETLTLRLDFQAHEKEHVMETYEIYDPKEQSSLSKHLKVVKIIRSSMKQDVIVDRILKILCAHGVLFRAI